MKRAVRWLLIAAAAIGVGWWVWARWMRPFMARPPAAEWNAVVVTLAGDGVAGFRDGDSSAARFSDPFGVAPAADGSIYVADAGGSQRIRRVAPDGTVSTIAGGERGYADGAGASARFDTPSGIAVDAAGAIYVADTGNNAIRRITRDGVVSTLARAPELNGPIGVAIDRAGRVIVADTYNDRIRTIEPDGQIVTLAGGERPGAVDGPASEARFHTPCGVAVDASGSVYVADTGNRAVRVISPAGLVSTLGPLPPYGISRPIAIAAGADGALYVSDEGARILQFTPGRGFRTLAGSRHGFADGQGARFRTVMGLAVAAPGRLIATDSLNATVRLVLKHREIKEIREKSNLPDLPDLPVLLVRRAPQFKVDAFALEPLLWPLVPMDGPYEITGTLGELRGGEGAERLHAGVDVHAAEGTPVVAVRDGIIADPFAVAEFDTINESVRIGPLAYVHVRVGRESRYAGVIDPSRFVAAYDDTGRISLIRARRGARFLAGEAIGSANAFNHVHLNVGWPGEEYNPLRFRLPQFHDRRRPSIRRNGIRLLRDDGTPFIERKGKRLIVDGAVQIVVDAWDQIDGNERKRRLGIYRLGYQVLNRDGSPAVGFTEPRETIVFDRFGGSDAARTVYAPGSGIPYFGRRSTRFLYVVTNTLHDGVASAGRWDTTLMPPGDYTLRVIAADTEGNEATANRDVAITIAAPPR